jgi:glycosyltransferase involved in cell wall biosynthesis
VITILIPTRDSARLLGPTLGALAPGLSSGLIREVVFADEGSTDETAAIAEEVGARFTRAPFDPAAARGAWLLRLPDAARLTPNWPEALRRHIAGRPDRGGWAPLSGAPLANLRARLTVRPGPRHPALAPLGAQPPRVWVPLDCRAVWGGDAP